MNTDHAFDPNNIAQVMREIFVHLMNAIPETEMDRQAAFWKAQEQLVPIRNKVDVAHRRIMQTSKTNKDEISLGALGLVMYERVVVDGLTAMKAADFSTIQLIRQAEAIQPILDVCNEFKQAYLHLLGWRFVHGVKVA